MNWSAPSTGRAGHATRRCASTIALRPQSLAQFIEIDVAAHPRQRQEIDVRIVEAPIYLLVFVPPLLDVPSRQAVLDFPVGPGILFNYDHLRAALGQDVGDFSACGSGADYRDDVPRHSLWLWIPSWGVNLSVGGRCVKELRGSRRIRYNFVTQDAADMNR